MPLEPAAEHRPGHDDDATFVAHIDQTARHVVDEGRRNDRRHPGHRPATAVAGDDARPSRRGKHLLDQERDTLRASDKSEYVVTDRRSVEARRHHRRHRRVVQSIEHQRLCGPARRQSQRACPHVAGFVRPPRRCAEDTLTRQVVGEVVEDRPRLGVCPVQILENQQTANRSGRRAKEPQNRLSHNHHGRLDHGGTGIEPIRDQRPEEEIKGRQVPRAGARPPRTSEQKDSATGRYATEVVASTARPRSTTIPRSVASAASTSSSRDLPMPASPTTTAAPPRPSAAASRHPLSTDRSASRPTSCEETRRSRAFTASPIPATNTQSCPGNRRSAFVAMGSRRCQCTALRPRTSKTAPAACSRSETSAIAGVREGLPHIALTLAARPMVGELSFCVASAIA